MINDTDVLAFSIADIFLRLHIRMDYAEMVDEIFENINMLIRIQCWMGQPAFPTCGVG